MAAPAPKPKFTTTTIIIYAIVAVLIVIFCAMLGTAMDFAAVDGKVDASKLGDTFSYVTSHVGTVFTALNTKQSFAQKMTLLGLFGFGIFILYKWAEDPQRTHRKGVEHGSAKWGTAQEMRSLADEKCTYYDQKKTTAKERLLNINGSYLTDDKGNYLKAVIDNNILFSEEVKLSLNAKQHMINHNVLIVGGSGSGKTRFYAKPNTMQLNTSYVITDPKGEILQSTGKMLEAAGYKVRVFNLIEMEHSNNYNPFEYVYDHEGNLSADNVKKMVRVLFDATKGDGEKTDFWAQKGQTMLEAIVYLLFEESEYNMQRDENGNLIPETRDKTHLNFFSVTEKMRKLRYPPKGSRQPDGFFVEPLEDETPEQFAFRQQSECFLCPLDKDYIELQRRKPDTLAYRLYKEVRNAPVETGQSFLSSANVKTFMFNLPSLRNLTCCDNIHLETLGDEKTALFIIISATDSTYNFMAAMLYTQMFDTLSNRANFKYKDSGQRLPVPVRCIMDEFANLGQIPDFEKVIAFVRSMGMSLNVIVQNIAQLKAKYEKTWEIITGNCDTLLFLGGKEESTLKYISESLGKETIDVRGYNKTKGKTPSTSENNSILGRELMQPNEIATMPIGDCIVMIRSHNPFYCHKYPIEKHPNYAFLGDGRPEWEYDVSTVHSISVEELEAQAKKVDTCVNLTKSVTAEETAAEKEKIVTIFEAAEDMVTSEPFIPEDDAEAEAPAEQPDGSIETDKHFGEPSALESSDLGEPIAASGEVSYDADAEDPLSDTALSTGDESDTDVLEEYFGEPIELECFDEIPEDIEANVLFSDHPDYAVSDFDNGF